MIASLVLGLVAVLVYFAWFCRDRRAEELINLLPGPSPLPIIGNAHQLNFGHAWVKQILGFVRDFPEGIIRFWVAKNPIVAIWKPSFIEAVVNNTKHIDKAREYDYLHPWLGTGLLTSTGDKWRSRRKLLTPTFHFNILNDFQAVFCHQADTLVRKLRAKATSGPFDIFQDITHCALDIICETAMGTTVDAQSKDSEYVRALYRMTTLFDERTRTPHYRSDFLYPFTSAGREHKRTVEILHKFTNSVIKDRLKDFDDKKSQLIGQQMSNSLVGGKKVRLAFLDMLLYMSDNLTKLDLSDIREEVDTFMFEGHDTTAAAMNWAVHLIGSHPDVQARVHDELDAVFGSDDRHATMEDLKELKYLECCIKETLRIYPAVPIFGRAINEDLALGEHTIPKGTTVLVFTFALHRDPKTFPDPEKFKPERFLLEESHQRHPYSYVPFSAGPRNCIGQKFALQEEKTVLSAIFRNFRVKATQSGLDELRPVADVILRPENGIRVEVTPRGAH